MTSLELAKQAAVRGAQVYYEVDFSEYDAKPYIGLDRGDGVLDSFTAGYIVQTYEGLNTEQRESFRSLSITAMANVAMKLAGVT